MTPERTAFQLFTIVVILTALVVAPAAADRNVKTTGATVYVGEENINFAGFPGVVEGVTVGQLVHYSDYTAKAIDKTIPADANGNITELTRSAVGTTTDPSYYVFAEGKDPLKDEELGYVNIQYPEATLDVVLNTSRQDPVNGKSVTRDNELAFKLTNNLNGLKGTGATMNIEITQPSGGVTTNFGGVNTLKGVIVDGTTAWRYPVILTDAEAGTYTAIAKWPSGTDFYGKGFDSKSVTFEVLPEKLAISPNKDIVVRGNSFTVTITGGSEQQYRLFVMGASISSEKYPAIAAGQNGLKGAYNATYNATLNGYYDKGTFNSRDMVVETSAGGTRSIQFNTNQSTEARQFTIRVEDPAKTSTYDEVVVRVEEGVVTITASGTGLYAIGEEITLSGTCTDNNTIYLFLTGPNLDSNGASPKDLMAGFMAVTVEADDTWSYKWDTGGLLESLSSSGYTIYAVSKPVLRNELSGAKYATVAVQLRPASLTARTSGTTLTRGDDYRISGIATGDPGAVQIWITGPNYYKLGAPVTVESDGSFEYVLTSAETSNLAKGQYYVVVQHPMREGFGVCIDPGTGFLTGPGMCPVNLRALRPSDAATALINALDSPYVDDAYIKFSFSVDVSWIWIDGLSDQTYGEAFTVTGTTDYPAGTALTYRITANEDGVNVLSGEAVVGDNGDWSFEVDTTVIGPGAYTLLVAAPDGKASTVALFDVYDEIAHPIPPGGATYRVERLSVNHSLDDLSPGERVALDGTIGCCCPRIEYYGCLEFSTDLQDPVWSYNLKVDGNMLYTDPMTVSSRSFALSGWELYYGREDVRICLSLSGTVPGAGTGDPALIRILERDADGRTIPDSEYRLSFTPAGDDPAPPFGDNLALHPGWNFISVPRPLAAGSDTASIFAAVETAGHSALRYDTAAGTWVALTATDRIVPLEGIWIYSIRPATVPLRFSTDLPLPPAERSLTPGWNAVGITGTASASARDALLSVNRGWTTLIGFDTGKQAFETAIINGGSGDYTDNRLVYQGRGYWLHMTEPGTLCAIGV